MKYQNNQEDECFLESQTQLIKNTQDTQQNIELDDQIRNILPQANQLKPQQRPTIMAPRIMKKQPQIYKLPIMLNSPCVQTVVDTKNSNGKPKIGNKQKLSLGQYLNKNQFYVVYNKHNHPNTLVPTSKCNDLTIRLRPITNISDYNYKLFKQLRYQNIAQNCLRDEIDSNFECGNLSRAYGNYHKQSNYYLLLEQDTNTHGYTNWFFFRFRNKGIGRRKFYILNMAKPTSFYKQGMKISVFSMNKSKKQQLAWHKACQEISFFQTNFIRNEEDYFNCLYFEYDFQLQEDEVYFAPTQPYTYSRLINLLQQSQRVESKGCNIKIQTVGYSVSNNIIPAITLFSEGQQKKQSIVFIGRQHPSEMAGSFISEFLIKILLQFDQQNSPFITFILSKFNIVVIPIVNPDGVIYGNSRSNLTGYDLNRHWGADSIKQMIPQTFKIRTFLCALQKKSKISFLLDLHGHGKMLNSFLYSCKNKDKIAHRHFPMIMSKMEKRFSLSSCTYGILKDKQNTIRAQLYEIGITNCYTLENSYFGYNKQHEIQPYQQQDYYQIALSLIKSLFIFYSSSTQQKVFAQQKLGHNLQTINEQLRNVIQILQKQEKLQVQKEDLMSQSDPEGDGLKLQERLIICNNNKKLDKKIREQYKKTKMTNKKNKKYNAWKGKIKNENNEAQDENIEQQKTKITKKHIKSRGNFDKKLRIQQKLKTNVIEKNKQIQKKQNNKLEQPKNNRKKLTIGIVKPLNFQTSSQFLQKSNSFLTKTTKPYERIKIYEKIKTQISQQHEYSENQIKQQFIRKEKRQYQFDKIKNESLKNMMNQSFLFSIGTTKNKKCKWIEQKQKSQKIRTSYSLLQARLHYHKQKQEDLLQSDFIYQRSSTNPNISDALKMMPDYSKSTPIKKEFDPSRKTSSNRNYHKFQKYTKRGSTVKTIPKGIKTISDGRKSVFYYFPAM